MSGRRNSNYPPEMSERAIRMVAELTSSRGSQWAAIEAVASAIGDRLKGEGPSLGAPG